MSKFLFILGAGCSQDSGVPLMYDFLERSEDLLLNGEAGPYQDDFELVLKARRELQQTHSKSNVIDLHNLETVFSAFEFANLVKS